MAIIQSNEASFQEDVLNSKDPVVVDFWAPWCGPCKIIAPIMEEIASEFEGKLKAVKVNVEESQGVAQKYGIMSIPTLILFNNGEVIDKNIGVMPKPKLVEWLKSKINL